MTKEQCAQKLKVLANQAGSIDRQEAYNMAAALVLQIKEPKPKVVKKSK